MKTGTLNIAVAAIVAGLLVSAVPAAAGKPLNAGQTGIKSNAGGGNGAEAGAVIGEPVVVDSITEYGDLFTEKVGDGVTVPLELPTSTSVTTKTQVGPAFQPVNPHGDPVGNMKALFEFTTATTTWSGEAWVTTYETVIKQEVVKVDTTTTTFADIDPGNSGAHNKAPEAATVVETAVSDPYASVIDIGPGDPVEELGGGFTSVTLESSKEMEHPCSGEGNSCSF